MKENLRQPCKECPFRRDSARGWLGGYDGPEHFLAVHYHAEERNPCHLSIDYETDRETWDPEACVGQVVMFKNSYKLPRGWEMPEAISADADACFRWSHEFVAHHQLPGTSAEEADK